MSAIIINKDNFEAEVLWCEENSDGMFDIILNRTAFFPEGGGQSSDEGTLDGQDVLFLRTENNETTIVHTVKKPIPVGKLVYGEINMKERFSRMQNHTAEHICSGIIYSLYGFNNIGFHMGQDEITMDFDGLFTQEQINNIEFLANEAVYKNVPVKFSFCKPNEADNIFYRSKKKIETTLRLVEIEGIDVCACCAPHVSRTGEIGVIKILGFQKYKGGTRISLLAGERAFKELNKHFNSRKCFKRVNKLFFYLKIKHSRQIIYCVLAGVEGFEPSVVESESTALTAWPHPKICRNVSTF